jgi:hypothetical protein
MRPVARKPLKRGKPKSERTALRERGVGVRRERPKGVNYMIQWRYILTSI